MLAKSNLPCRAPAAGHPPRRRPVARVDIDGGARHHVAIGSRMVGLKAPARSTSVPGFSHCALHDGRGRDVTQLTMSTGARHVRGPSPDAPRNPLGKASRQAPPPFPPSGSGWTAGMGRTAACALREIGAKRAGAHQRHGRASFGPGSWPRGRGRGGAPAGVSPRPSWRRSPRLVDQQVDGLDVGRPCGVVALDTTIFSPPTPSSRRA